MRSLAARPVHVVGAQHIGERDPVEAAPLKGAHEIVPLAQGRVSPRCLVGGVLPHSVDLMIGGRLDEGVRVRRAVSIWAILTASTATEPVIWWTVWYTYGYT